MPKAKQTIPKDRKLRVAIAGLTSCEGCSFAILDLGAEFIGAVDHFDLGDFHLIMNEKKNKKYDYYSEGNIDHKDASPGKMLCEKASEKRAA